MNSENIKTIGITAIAGGIVALLFSGYGAYTFPTSNAPANADLVTLLTIGWQRLVIAIAGAIAGTLGILAGTILYGFGRVIDEAQSFQEKDGKEQISKRVS